MVELNVNSYTVYVNLLVTHCSCKLQHFLGKPGCGVVMSVEVWNTDQNPI